MVRFLLGNNTNTFLVVHIWTLYFDGPSTWCSNGTIRESKVTCLRNFLTIVCCLIVWLKLQVFTCVALFNNLISPLNSFPWVINGLIDVSCENSFVWEIILLYFIIIVQSFVLQAVISSRRLCKYLSCFERETNMEQPSNCSVFSSSDKQTELQDVAVVIRDASCTWSCRDQKEIDLVLDPVNLLIPKGLLVAVVGEVKLYCCYK